MNNLYERLKKTKTESATRIPSFIIKGDASVRFDAVCSATDQSATKLAAALIEHVLENDSTIKRILTEQGPKIENKNQPVRTFDPTTRQQKTPA